MRRPKVEVELLIPERDAVQFDFIELGLPEFADDGKFIKSTQFMKMCTGLTIKSILSINMAYHISVDYIV